MLALFCLIMGFAMLARAAPEPDAALHEAMATGDEATRQALEDDLAGRRLRRTILIGGFFGGAVLLTIIGFAAMQAKP